MKQRALFSNGNRIAWVDILRFLGMVLIYWGHLSPSPNVTLYIFAHHVPLFFFISGFFAPGGEKEGNFGRFVWKKVRGLVLPYVIFTLLYYALQLITGALTLSALPVALLISAQGVRNAVPGPLWFFSCLFVVSIVYEGLSRLLKRRAPLLLAAAGLLYLIGIFCLGHEPAQEPLWVWNVDSALIYLFYYALGAHLFPRIRNWRYAAQKTAHKVLFFCCFALSALFGLFTLCDGAQATAGVSQALASAFGLSVLADAVFELYGLVSALIFIFFELCLARFLSLIPGIGRFLAFVGKDSLYHCGNELLIKYFGGLLLSVTGLTAALSSDLFTLAYSICCLLVLTFTLNLLERLLFGPLFQR